MKVDWEGPEPPTLYAAGSMAIVQSKMAQPGQVVRRHGSLRVVKRIVWRPSDTSAWGWVPVTYYDWVH